MSDRTFTNCATCSQGCDTFDHVLNGTCPKYWQRPADSLPCSQAWTCSSASLIGYRIIGVCFFVVTLVYFRLIYYNCMKIANTPDVQQLQHRGSASGSSRGRKFLRAIDPQMYARLINACAASIRAFDNTMIATHNSETSIACPACFDTNPAIGSIMNLLFNIPITMMILSTLIILTTWINIHDRCVDMTSIATTRASRVCSALLSKPVMFASTFVWAALFLYFGHEAQAVAASSSTSVNGRNYVVVLTLWLLQYFIFCFFWARRVAIVVSQARNIVQSFSHDTDSSLLECFALTWVPFAEAMCLPKCARFATGREPLLPADSKVVSLPPPTGAASTSGGILQRERGDNSNNSEVSENSETEGSSHLCDSVSLTQQMVVTKLRVAVARVRYAQFVATAVVIFSVLFLALGQGLGYFASGADAGTYNAFQIMLRVFEVGFFAGLAVFLA